MKNIMIALRYLVVMTLLTGIIYPLVVTGLGQVMWAKQAGGSLINQDGHVIGSELIAQKFTQDKYFWPRPSATDYNAAASSGSNRGPINAALKKSFDENTTTSLNEMKFTSGSGLDPHITPAAVQEQIERVANARQLNPEQKNQLKQLTMSFVEARSFGFLGEPRVNVLKLNLALDQQF